MSTHLFIGLLLTAGLVAGYPYVDLILNRMIGTAPVTMIEHNGLQRTAIMGPDAPRPAWLPILPHATVTHATHWLPSPALEAGGSVDLLTHGSLEDVKSFYLQALTAAGFQMRDAGYGPMSPPIAAHLGVDNILLGYRSETKIALSITTRAPAGVLSESRIVQILWHKRDRPFEHLSATPSMAVDPNT